MRFHLRSDVVTDAGGPKLRRKHAGGAPADVGELATKYGCHVVVVVPQDGAWTNDPFAASAAYRLAESREGRWRIYVKSPSIAKGQK